jgi:hypothetical protein
MRRLDLPQRLEAIRPVGADVLDGVLPIVHLGGSVGRSGMGGALDVELHGPALTGGGDQELGADEPVARGKGSRRRGADEGLARGAAGAQAEGMVAVRPDARS